MTSIHLKFLKDKRFRNNFFKNEKKRKILKFLTYKKSTSRTLKQFFSLQLFSKNLTIKSSITRIKNMCLITGRTKGILSFFKMSRHTFKKYASEGLLNPLTKP